MDLTTMEQLVASICSVYKNRGYVTLDEVQTKLDDHNATLVETTRVMRLLSENGCKVVDRSADEDFDQYTETTSTLSATTIGRIREHVLKEKADPIAGLDYCITEHENAMVYYIYLRYNMKLTKPAARSSISDLQKAYLLFLGNGEDKCIFDVQSADFARHINSTLHDKKQHKKVPAAYKNATATYQYFLEKNRHRIIANFEEQLTR